jgi:predicted enzyme related to lactoylglutathione lyase
MEVPDVGRMAALMDPQGAAFSVIQNAGTPT